MPLKQKISLSSARRNPLSCDRCVLNLLHPHLIQPEGDNSTCHQIQLLLKQFKQAVDREGVVNLAIDGQVQFITPQAEQRLKRYFSCQDSHVLPEPLHQWFRNQTSKLTGHSRNPSTCPSFSIEQAEQRLMVHLLSDPLREQYLLLVEEREPLSFSIVALESLGLTRRQAEVLFWVAKDKSNAEIAKVLDCCEGTIRKHLENLYKKLNVQTRMGAVMTALEKLGLLQT